MSEVSEGQELLSPEELFGDLRDAAAELDGARARYRASWRLVVEALGSHIGRKVAARGIGIRGVVISETGVHVAAPVGSLLDKPKIIDYTGWKLIEVDAEEGNLHLSHPESDTFYHIVPVDALATFELMEADES